jgi:periplasmic divalent cation tolerance protein
MAVPPIPRQDPIHTGVPAHVAGAPPAGLAVAFDALRARPLTCHAMSALIVITTVGDEEQALLIARELVARRLAACVNVLSGMRSVYRWQGKICRDSEYLLVVKTLSSEYDAVAAAIRELHSYELPEILAFAASHGDDRFLAWIGESVDKSRVVVGVDEDDEGDGFDLDDSRF